MRAPCLYHKAPRGCCGMAYGILYIFYLITQTIADACSGSVPAYGPAVQVLASSTASQGATATERTQQSHHEKPESAAAHPASAADGSPLFIRTYI